MRRSRFQFGFRLCRLLLTCLAIALSSVAQAQLKITAVTDSAAFQPGLPQKGSLATIFTTGLQGSGGIVINTQNPLSNSLLDIQVWINSTPAPILSISFTGGYQQINVQVPWEGERDPIYVEVIQSGSHASFEGKYTTSDFYPRSGSSVFFVDSSGHAILQHASDYSLVTRESPAHGGEYIIAYGINLGPVASPPKSGYPVLQSQQSMFDPLMIGGFVCSGGDMIIIGGQSVGPTYDGLAPGLVGVYQLNFQIPQGLSDGDLPLAVRRNLSIFPFLTACRPDQQHSIDTITSLSALIPVQR